MITLNDHPHEVGCSLVAENLSAAQVDNVFFVDRNQLFDGYYIHFLGGKPVMLSPLTQMRLISNIRKDVALRNISECLALN